LISIIERPDDYTSDSPFRINLLKNLN